MDASKRSKLAALYTSGTDNTAQTTNASKGRKRVLEHSQTMLFIAVGVTLGCYVDKQLHQQNLCTFSRNLSIFAKMWRIEPIEIEFSTKIRCYK
ncbi:MAG: hypothetical protein IPG23_15040 [Burkholderiales bacterium]|nr:hypothetical protein [Burkholderiales bacterium]